MQATHLKGITAILIAVIAFSVMDAALKQLGQTYSPFQVSALRGWSSLPFVLLLVLFGNRWGELKPVRWPLHLVRGLLAIAMLALFIYSVRSLSLSSAYAIFLCAPLLVTALSVVLLHERVDWQRWIAIAVGLVGVLAMLRPTSVDVISLGALAAFAAAICYAYAAIMIRLLSRTESTLSITFSFLVIVAIVATALAYPDWVTPKREHFTWIAILGFAGAIGQYFIIEAFRQAPVAVVAPFDYTALLWGALLDWIIWQTLPEARMVAGGAIVIASGLYLIYRERQSSTAMHA